MSGLVPTNQELFPPLTLLSPFFGVCLLMWLFLKILDFMLIVESWTALPVWQFQENKIFSNIHWTRLCDNVGGRGF